MTESIRSNHQREEYLSRINRVIDYIENNLDQELSLRKLSSLASFSQFYFHRIFKAMVGETLNQFIQRIRIEKAARRLLVHPQKTITEIALDTGFSSSAAFARSFKDYFDMSSSQFRIEAKKDDGKIRKIKDKKRQSIANNRKEGSEVTIHIDPATHNFVWRIPMSEINDIQVEIKEMPEMHVAYVRHIGPYKADEDLFRQLFVRLMKWAVPRNLYKPNASQCLTAYHDDHTITDEEKLRISASLVVPEGTEVSGEIGKMTIRAGTHAVARCEIRGDQYEQAWDGVVGNWLPGSGYQPDDGLSLELYRNNPEEHPRKHHILDICFPVKPL